MVEKMNDKEFSALMTDTLARVSRMGGAPAGFLMTEEQARKWLKREGWNNDRVDAFISDHLVEDAGNED